MFARDMVNGSGFSGSFIILFHYFGIFLKFWQIQG